LVIGDFIWRSRIFRFNDWTSADTKIAQRQWSAAAATRFTGEIVKSSNR
jgi:hypothetical protein